MYVLKHVKWEIIDYLIHAIKKSPDLWFLFDLAVG